MNGRGALALGRLACTNILPVLSRRAASKESGKASSLYVAGIIIGCRLLIFYSIRISLHMLPFCQVHPHQYCTKPWSLSNARLGNFGNTISWVLPHLYSNQAWRSTVKALCPRAIRYGPTSRPRWKCITTQMALKFETLEGPTLCSIIRHHVVPYL